MDITKIIDQNWKKVQRYNYKDLVLDRYNS